MNVDLERREMELNARLMRFEQAMDHLTEKVAESREQVDRVVEMTLRPKVMVEHGVHQVQDVSRAVVTQVRQNRMPIAIAAVTFLGVYLVGQLYVQQQRKQYRRSFRNWLSI